MQGSETDQTIAQWVSSFQESYVQFSSLSASHSQPQAGDALSFAHIYHQLIHSPALETLLRLEHTYAMAVGEVCSAWDNAKDILTKKHDSAMESAINTLGRSSSDHEINSLMRKHTSEWETCEARWSSELSQLQETQRRVYREWVNRVHEEQQEGGAGRGEGRRNRGAPFPSLVCMCIAHV